MVMSKVQRESTTRGKRMPKQLAERKMSQEEFDREFTEVKERLNIIMELLQESERNQRWGWNVKKKVKWPIMTIVCKEVETKLEAQVECLDEGRETQSS
jgi:hypothetical protein